MAASESSIARASRVAAAVRAVLPALLVVLLGGAAVWDAAVRASWASLGRDQGIFQYVAWAVGQGDVAYRDVRDVNGPVITMVHVFFQLLGGSDEHRFRILDLACTGLSYAVAGALVPSILSGTRCTPPLVRLAWAVAAWVALTAHYTIYGFWDTAQRESFLGWFVLVAVALQATHWSSGDVRARRTAIVLVTSGFLSFVPWLGKPTFALFTFAQLIALGVDAGNVRARLRRVGLFLAGGAAGLAVPLAWVALRGDLGAWARITFVDVPAMYRFIWHRPPGALFSLPGYSALVWMSGATTGALVALLALRRLPIRTLPIALMPVLGLVSVAVQAKGFPYHFHPVTLGLAFGWVVAIATTWQLALDARRTGIVLAFRAGVVIAAALLGARAGYLGWLAPFPLAPRADARDREALESAERLSAFDRIDYFPRALRDAAAYLAAHTKPDGRVQTYGMDAYLLFLAGRKSATPYIYAYDLNADAAMHGSFDPGGLTPTAAEVERIRAMREEHARDLASRLERSPPAAFVFVDRSPLMTSDDAVVDFQAHCPAAAAWLAAHYRPAADFEGIRVWLPVGPKAH